jgi:hypothetical protein
MFNAILKAQRQAQPKWQGASVSFQVLRGSKTYQINRQVEEIALSRDPDTQKTLKTASLVEDFF